MGLKINPYICVPIRYNFKHKIMLVISSREFREKQKSYFDKLDEGIEIVIQRGKNRSYKITAITEDDTLMSKEEFLAKIDRSLQKAKEGKVIKQGEEESVQSFIDRLLCTD